jgi:hypothetical protein
MKGRIHPAGVEQGVVGTQEVLSKTWCVTGLQGRRAVLALSNYRSVLSQMPSPGVNTSDGNQSIHVSWVLLVALGLDLDPSMSWGVVGKVKGLGPGLKI